MYTFTYICMRVHIHTYIHNAHLSWFVNFDHCQNSPPTCMHAYIHKHIHTYTHVNKHARTHIHIHTHTHITYAYTYTYIQTHRHTHTYIYIHTYLLYACIETCLGLSIFVTVKLIMAHPNFSSASGKRCFILCMYVCVCICMYVWSN